MQGFQIGVRGGREGFAAVLCGSRGRVDGGQSLHGQTGRMEELCNALVPLEFGIGDIKIVLTLSMSLSCLMRSAFVEDFDGTPASSEPDAIAITCPQWMIPSFVIFHLNL